MKKAFYPICVLLFFFSSCKSPRVANSSVVKKLKADKIISNHYNQAFNFNTLNAKVKVKYDDGKKAFAPNVTIRMKKDEVIWISSKLLGITIAKVLITPTKVQYYEKLGSTFFEGDFEVLSNWLGMPLNFEKVQQLLLGQSLFDLQEDRYNSKIVEEKYQLKPKKKGLLFERLFLIHPNSFKMSIQQLSQPSEQRDVKIKYLQYQKIGNQDFPKEIYILAAQGAEKTNINLIYKMVDYNAKVGFPYKVPTGYQEVKIP